MAKELKTAAWGSLCSCRAIIDSCWQIIAHRCRCWRIIKDGYCCLYTHCLLTLASSSLWRLNFFYWNALQLLFEPDAHNDLLNLFKNHQDASDLHFSLHLRMFFRCHFFMGLNCQAISYQISFLCLEKKSYNNKSPLEMVLCNAIHQRPINSSRPQSSIENLLFAVGVKQIEVCRRFTSKHEKPFWEIKKGFGKSTFDNQCRSSCYQ